MISKKGSDKKTATEEETIGCVFWVSLIAGFFLPFAWVMTGISAISMYQLVKKDQVTTSQTTPGILRKIKLFFSFILLGLVVGGIAYLVYIA